MIRALLLKEWPALSHLFGIRPWETDMLSTTELSEYIRQGRGYLASGRS
jgi:hypothetical protein